MKHNFVHLEYPLTHPGVDRAEQAVANIKRMSDSFSPTRTLAAMLLAAIVAAFVVVADHRSGHQREPPGESRRAHSGVHSAVNRDHR